jgi:hypothetical protein
MQANLILVVQLQITHKDVKNKLKWKQGNPQHVQDLKGLGQYNLWAISYIGRRESCVLVLIVG